MGEESHVSSILTTIKLACNVAEEDEAFDNDFILFINGILANLNQIGIGPEEGFQIEDKAATWDSYLDGDPRLNNVKVYIQTKARLLFDPPQTGPLNSALENIAKELETRIYIAREAREWENRPPSTILNA
jgi:hypothetical protein